MNPEPPKVDRPGPDSTSLVAMVSTAFDKLDRIALTRAVVALTAAGLVLTVGWRASRPAEAPAAEAEAVVAAAPIESVPLSSWPAGPLSGTKPAVLSAQPVRPDGCVEAESETDVDLRLTDAVSLWIFADADADADVAVTADWQDDQGTVTFTIPPQHFAHEFTPGRVTLSAITPSGATTLAIRSTSGPIRVCGIETKVG